METLSIICDNIQVCTTLVYISEDAALGRKFSDNHTDASEHLLEFWMRACAQSTVLRFKSQAAA